MDDSGDEAPGARVQVQAGSAEGERAVRAVPGGDQRLQRQVHGGHDGGVRQVPGVRGAAAGLLQGDAVRDTRVPQHIHRRRVSATFNDAHSTE